jgi:hypothetical protein
VISAAFAVALALGSYGGEVVSLAQGQVKSFPVIFGDFKLANAILESRGLVASSGLQLISHSSSMPLIMIRDSIAAYQNEVEFSTLRERANGFRLNRSSEFNGRKNDGLGIIRLARLHLIEAWQATSRRTPDNNEPLAQDVQRGLFPMVLCDQIQLKFEAFRTNPKPACVSWIKANPRPTLFAGDSICVSRALQSDAPLINSPEQRPQSESAQDKLPSGQNNDPKSPHRSRLLGGEIALFIILAMAGVVVGCKALDKARDARDSGSVIGLIGLSLCAAVVAGFSLLTLGIGLP